MNDSVPLWEVNLDEKPDAALMALGNHGPRVTERFTSIRHWWLHLYKYSANLRLNGRALRIEPCTISLVPPGVELEYDFIDRSQHLCAHFTLPDSNTGKPVSIPALQNLGDRFPEIYASFEEAAAGFTTNKLRSEVRLWDILWQLPNRRPEGELTVKVHPSAVERVAQLIELRMSEPLSVRDLAAEAGISHNQLTRLFRKAQGNTVIGYIRRRRVQRATHFLEHTTLPIKVIAEQVGVEDPKFFYKMIKQALGMSPSEVRARAAK